MISKLVALSGVKKGLEVFSRRSLFKARASCFCTDLKASRQSLIPALEKEIKLAQQPKKLEEVKSNEIDVETMDPRSALKALNFETKEVSGRNPYLIVSKKLGEMEVSVYLSLVDISPEDPFQDDEFDIFKNDPNITFSQEGFDEEFKFEIFLTKPGQKTLVISCLGENDYTITYIRLIDDIEAYLNKTRHIKNPKHFYAGPEFSTLGERLQTQFYEFLSAHELDRDTIDLIVKAGMEWRDTFYLRWLQSLNNFVVEEGSS